MLVISFLITLIILSVGYARDENYDSEYPVNEENSREVRLSDIYSKLDVLRKKSNDLEEIVHEKFQKLEKNILDKLEDYIEGKLDSVEKNSNRKIDSLETNTNRYMDSLEKNMKNAIDLMESNVQRRMEAMQKNMSDKADIFIMNQNFDSLKKLYTGANVNIISESQTSANNSLPSTEEVSQTTRIPDFDMSFKQGLEAFVKNFSELLDKNLNSKLTVLQNNILEKIESSIINNTNINNLKLDEQISPIQNISRNRSLTVLENNILEKNESSIINNTNINNLNLDEQISPIQNISRNRSQNSDSCKKRVTHRYDYHPMRLDNETFNHVTAEINANGLVRFEMHLAIMSTGLPFIQLSSLPYPGAVGSEYILIAAGDAGQTATNLYFTKQRNAEGNQFDIISTLRHISTPGIMSNNSMTAFYVKIEGQTLRFGKTGNLPPILTYNHELFSKVKYIGFTSRYSAESTFLYDCPPGYEDML